MHKYVVVDGYVPTELDNTNLRDEAWSFALDQRCFGPRKFLVGFADSDGTFRGIAFTKRHDNPEAALGPCILHLGMGSAAAVVFCDEEVKPGPLSPDLAERFARAKSIAAAYGVHLVDWFSCDDDLFRSTRLALEPDAEWWDVPTHGTRQIQ